MKEVVDALLKYNIVCKKLEKISFPTKKRVDVFLGVNLKSEYCLVVRIYKKSRFLRKDIEFLNEIEKFFKINFRRKKKIVILKEICSKAKSEINEWRVIDGIG
jgi:hypothetical protein